MGTRVLIVEDDRTLARVIGDNLAMAGYQAAIAGGVNEALNQLQSTPPDLILLDLMLGGADGFELCGLFRERTTAPIIIVSARSQKADKLKGLNLGADDYLTKPFDLEELLARIRAVLRRAHTVPGESVTIGRLAVDFRNRLAMCGSEAVHLTHREFEVLSYLVKHQEKVVPRSKLLQEIWGYPDDHVVTRSVDHAIARLRKKIEPDPHHPRFIRTAHGNGYCLICESPKPSPRDR